MSLKCDYTGLHTEKLNKTKQCNPTQNNVQQLTTTMHTANKKPRYASGKKDTKII